MVTGVHLGPPWSIFPTLLCLCWPHSQICPSYRVARGPAAIWAFFWVSDSSVDLCPHDSPREGPRALWTTFCHIWKQSLWQERKKKYMDGPALDQTSKPGGASSSMPSESGWWAWKVGPEKSPSLFPFPFAFVPFSTPYVYWGALYLLLDTPRLLAYSPKSDSYIPPLVIIT